MSKRRNSIRNITRFTYKTASFQGWRLAVCRHHVNFVRYFSDLEYGGEAESLAAALAVREQVYAYLEAYPYEPKRAMELCRRELLPESPSRRLTPRRIRHRDEL